jgi:hypothetical protein
MFDISRARRANQSKIQVGSISTGKPKYYYYLNEMVPGLYIGIGSSSGLQYYEPQAHVAYFRVKINVGKLLSAAVERTIPTLV